MRRDRIIEAINKLREALIDSQVREILRVCRSGQNAEDSSMTQKLLMAYSIFSQHHLNFGEEEKFMMSQFGLTPLVNVNFWSSLLEGDSSLSPKMLSDIEVGVYNIVYVMPKFKDLLVRHTDKTGFFVKLQDGLEQEVSRLRVFIAEQGDALTDTSVVTNVIRAVEELYESFSYLHKNGYVALTLGSLDSGTSKSFDFFGNNDVMIDISAMLTSVWHKVKFSGTENIRYQIEVAMMASGFIARVTETQRSGTINEEEGQRIIRTVARAIETLFQNGAYTSEMDRVEESRASTILQKQTAMLEMRPESRYTAIAHHKNAYAPQDGYNNGNYQDMGPNGNAGLHHGSMANGAGSNGAGNSGMPYPQSSHKAKEEVVEVVETAAE